MPMPAPHTDHEILEAHRPQAVVAEVERRFARAAAARRRRRAQIAAPLAAAAAATLMVLAGPLDMRAESEGERAKGPAATMVIYRATPRGAEKLRAESAVTEGDVLQVTYQATAKRFGVIASLDGRGEVTLHLPESPGAASVLDPSAPTALEHAYKLDDAPGFEEFQLVTSEQPFSTSVVAEALRSSKPLPEQFTVTRIRLVKEAR